MLKDILMSLRARLLTFICVIAQSSHNSQNQNDQLKILKIRIAIMNVNAQHNKRRKINKSKLFHDHRSFTVSGKRWDLPSWPSYCSLCHTYAAASPSSWREDEASARSSEMLVVCQPSCSCLVANVHNMSVKASCTLLVCKRLVSSARWKKNRHGNSNTQLFSSTHRQVGCRWGSRSTYTSHAQCASHMSSHIHSSGFSQGSPQI